jgi:dienelactone hydrolase
MPQYALGQEGNGAAAAASIDKRRAELERLLSRLPKSEPFTRWLKETGELPPDFDALPSSFEIQDPLTWDGGGKVSRDQWPRRRAEILKLTEQWLLGTAPPPPGNVEGEVLEKRKEGQREVWDVKLRFGPRQAAQLSATLHLPLDQSKPAPIFLCDSDRYRVWAQDAMAEGFGFCTHAARDRNDESWAYAKLFGDYDWSSFRRRGWSASRVVDWLITLPFVDAQRIFIGGHSRSAKQAMAGAAFDERIAGAIASSPGSGGSLPYRYCDQSVFGESAEVLTNLFPDWVHPRVRFFAGREHKLPADSHFIYALLAPRPLMISTATEDTVENTFAVEQLYQTLQPLYATLDKEKNLAFRYRPGPHATDEPTAHAFSQFLLSAAGRADKPPAELFPFTPFHVWNYASWARQHEPTSAPRPLAPLATSATSREAWPARRQQIRGRILWLLGDGPKYQAAPVEFGMGESESEEKSLGRANAKAPRRVKMRFGDGVNGYLFAPKASHKLPCVVWLPPFHTAKGFIAGPRGYRYAEYSPTALVAAGFATVGFDHLGIGGRQRERRDFYDKHPTWSLVGKMVLDARHAIDAAAASPEVDPRRIYLYGFALGGLIATLVAALDDRVSGMVSVAGFTPLRTDTESKGTGGIRRHSQLYGRIPRLGPFIGREQEIPVDFDEILAAAAPRPTLVIAPQLDRYATLSDIEHAVSQAAEIYALHGNKDSLQLQTPFDEIRLTDPMQNEAISWLKQQSDA